MDQPSKTAASKPNLQELLDEIAADEKVGDKTGPQLVSQTDISSVFAKRKKQGGADVPGRQP